MWSLLLACTGAPDPAPVDDTQGCTPTVTWSGWAQGYFRTWCGACHSATTPDRRGAPVSVDFDTLDQVLTYQDAVRAAVLEQGTMPLGGGVFPQDQDLLQAFLDCPSAGDPVEGIDEPVPATPVLTEQAVVDQVQDVLAIGQIASPVAVLDRHMDWLRRADRRGCPIHIDGPSFIAPWEGCVTPEGWTFSGLAEFSGDQPNFREGSFDLLGDYSLISNQGHTFDAGGSAVVVREPGRVEFELNGTWADTLVTGWVSEWSGALTGAAEPDHLWLDGSYGVGDRALLFDGLELDGDCATGGIWVREDAGWHVLALDDCSCGSWTFAGQDQGSVCVDLAGRAHAYSGDLGL